MRHGGRIGTTEGDVTEPGVHPELGDTLISQVPRAGFEHLAAGRA
jgi:hypothetical protein